MDIEAKIMIKMIVSGNLAIKVVILVFLTSQHFARPALSEYARKQSSNAGILLANDLLSSNIIY